MAACGPYTSRLKFYLHNGGFRPIRSYLESIGWDLSTPIDINIPPKSHETIDLKISFLFDVDQYGMLLGRSGYAKNNGILVWAGS